MTRGYAATVCARFPFGLMIAAGMAVVLITGTHSVGAYCLSDADCDDGLFCTGVEGCDLGTNSCFVLSPCPPSIPPTVCNEITDTCDIYCVSDGDCDDGLFCNGVESCDLGTNSCVVVSACPATIPPTVCDEVNDSCEIYCVSDSDCDDGVFCNGVESCDLNTNSCVALSACPPAIPPTVCNEATDTCDPEMIFKDDFESGGTTNWN